MTKDLFEVFEQMHKTLEADPKTSLKGKTMIAVKKTQADPSVLKDTTDGIYPYRQELEQSLKEKKD